MSELEEVLRRRRALGARLAAFRQVAGLTQGRLAQSVFCDRTTIVHIEKGRRSADERFWRTADAAVWAGGALLADFRALQAAKLTHERRRHAEVTAMLRAHTVTTAAHEPAHPGAHLGDSAVALHDVDMAADESNAFLAWAENENVGELTLEQLHSEVRRLSQSYMKVPLGPYFARTRKLRDRAFTLLAGQQRPEHTRDLYAAAGWSLTMLAWMAVDLGRLSAAEDHARAAWLCAERADHNGLRAWVRATQWAAAFWNDRDLSSEFAADGLRYATGSAGLYLASAHASSLAHIGDAVRAAEALKQAQLIADAADQTADDLRGPFTCGVDRAGGLWAATRLALGDGGAALDHAERAIARFEADPPQDRSPGSGRAIRLDRVRALVQLGELAEAEAALVPILDTPVEFRMRPLMVRMSEVHATADTGPHRAETAAVRVRDAVTDFQLEAARRDLPA